MIRGASLKKVAHFPGADFRVTKVFVFGSELERGHDEFDLRAALDLEARDGFVKFAIERIGLGFGQIDRERASNHAFDAGQFTGITAKNLGEVFCNKDGLYIGISHLELAFGAAAVRPKFEVQGEAFDERREKRVDWRV